VRSERAQPSPPLQPFVECYWLIEFDEPPHTQKIIPDGFPEVIFHFEDPYRINLHGDWDLQAKSLFAGQIRKYFFLENTGRARMFGLKLKPTAPRHLFGLSMYDYTDQVADLSSIDSQSLRELETNVRAQVHFDKLVAASEQYLMSILERDIHSNQADLAIDLILQHKGSIDVNSICSQLAISERHLERLFRDYVGLPPKFYARIIRFSNIFKLVESQDPAWADLVYESGFYDQSHFIRNFKTFTGEDPSSYSFHEPTLANFFLKK